MSTLGFILVLLATVLAGLPCRGLFNAGLFILGLFFIYRG
jgi:energy-coupling factor transporter transmembrane protein EcfT